MKNFLLGVVLTLLAMIALAVAAVFSGVINIAADAPDDPWLFSIIAAAREQSIAHHSAGILVPANFTTPENVRRGAGNYEAMCVGCHLRPGETNSEIRSGLNPQPPDLSRMDHEDSAAISSARHFWIIKHGIKATGMPAWAKGGMEDGEIWNLVAFLQQLPRLSSDQYQALVASSAGHSHAGMTDSADRPHHESAGESAHEDDHAPTRSNSNSNFHSHAH